MKKRNVGIEKERKDVEWTSIFIKWILSFVHSLVGCTLGVSARQPRLSFLHRSVLIFSPTPLYSTLVLLLQNHCPRCMYLLHSLLPCLTPSSFSVPCTKPDVHLSCLHPLCNYACVLTLALTLSARSLFFLCLHFVNRKLKYVCTNVPIDQCPAYSNCAQHKIERGIARHLVVFKALLYLTPLQTFALNHQNENRLTVVDICH